jgi:DNA-binding winged helix-turn-helix (wHTH) protein/Tfp pilus assembly protein PilF
VKILCTGPNAYNSQAMHGCMKFADFELDADAYALRGPHGPVKLEKMPMEVLLLLVKRAGALVTRGEIQSALWGERVKVEYDAAINTIVRKIRHALADDSENPRFVETVIGKGYRFIAPLETTMRAGASPEPAAATRPVLPAAYEAYVRGRHAWNKRSEADLRDAIRLFQQAIDVDPAYAPAYAGLAHSYAQLGYGSYISPEDSFPRARAAALRALELDPTLSEAHAALGFALMYYDWDFAASEVEFRRALDLNANSALAHQWCAYLLTAMERPASDAEREIASAMRHDPLSAAIRIDYAYILHYYRRNDEALRFVRLALEMNPEFPLAYFWLARIHTSEERYEEAEMALQNIGPLRTWTPAMAVSGYLYGKTGRVDQARAVLARFTDLARAGRYASGYAVAVVHAGLGDFTRALETLQAAYDERSHWLVWLKRDPRWDEIRADRRFKGLVRQVGLPL